MKAMKTTITTDDGRVIEPDSIETYEILAELLGQIDTILQDQADIVVPSIFRDELHKGRTLLSNIRGESAEIARDARRKLDAKTSEADALEYGLANYRWRKEHLPKPKRKR
jgi:hypothetical protein